MDMAECIHHFFDNSPKRQLALEKWIADTLPDNEKRKKLKSVCKTRWVERHEAFEVFLDLFIPVVCCLEDIKMLVVMTGVKKHEEMRFHTL